MAKIVVDPPMGWRFGFPAVYDGELGDTEALEEFCKKRGYPQTLIDQGMLKHCRWWEHKDEERSEEAGSTDEGADEGGVDTPVGEMPA